MSEAIKVGLVGAGYAARGLAFQCGQNPLLNLVGVANRTIARANQMLADIGLSTKNIRVTDDFEDLVSDQDIEVIVEATGDVEFGARVAIKTIEAGKHLVLVNAELDGTLGPILKTKADSKGVIYTQADGDQPAVIMNLIREVTNLGMTPVLGGNIKTFFDRYRTPATQQEWAMANGQSLTLATSAVDGTKLAFEMATVANAVGFKVKTRGMKGFRASQVEEAADKFAKILPKTPGIVDYILGATPPFGVFVIATTEKQILREYLKQYKMGSGPYYLFYRPFHLCTLEAHKSIIDAAKLNQATLAPKDLRCEVVAATKRKLAKGETLDGIGGFTVYGLIDNASEVKRAQLLPIGLCLGAKVKRQIPKDHCLTYQDVDMPPEREVDRLYREQVEKFL